jgi:paraquat-inducible protein B
MKRHANAPLIGAFVVGGLALVIAAIIFTAGGKLFTRKERAVMHFSGSIYGLQVGAPVVFRGVKLGNVASIGLVYDRSKDSFSIPVVAELDRDVIRTIGGADAPGGGALTLPAMVGKGLRAQLAMQSLLTGQLYVDLDLRPGTTSVPHPVYTQAVEIPTSATTIQALKSQLDGLDVRALVDDISAIASSARSTLSGPELQQTLENLRQITSHVNHLSARLDARFDPLASAAQSTLADTGRSMRQIGQAADRVGALAAPDSALLLSVQRSLDELGRAAQALRQQAGPDSPLLQDLDGTLKDVARAARSIRELSDLLEQHPDALLRGRVRTESR